MLTFQTFRVRAVTDFSLFRDHLQESDLAMRTMGISLSTSVLRGHQWLPMATTCIQSSATHLQCPSMLRGLQRKPQHLSSTHIPSPQEHYVPQVRLLSITRGYSFWIYLLLWSLISPTLSITLHCQQGQSFPTCLPLWLVRVMGSASLGLWCSATVCLPSSAGLLGHGFSVPSCLCAYGCVV